MEEFLARPHLYVFGLLSVVNGQVFVPEPILLEGVYIILIDLLVDVDPYQLRDVKVAEGLGVPADRHRHELLQVGGDLALEPLKHQQFVGDQHGNSSLLALPVLLVLLASMGAEFEQP